jgi:uncharacterized protein
MLELRPVCENCGKKLPNESTAAMICSFECTFCEDCVNTILKNVCPNCGGGLEKRPIRPKEKLRTFPAEIQPILKPVNLADFAFLLENNKNLRPEKR